MRDERINGDWVADWDMSSESKFFPMFLDLEILPDARYGTKDPHDFYFKKKTFIEDLKALGWTEEELKIVWFRV